MSRKPTPWQVTLARLDCAVPFLPASVTAVLAQRSLRRMWQAHIELFPFSQPLSQGNADELMRTGHQTERRDFLSWIALRGHTPLASAARLAATTSAGSTGTGDLYEQADRALAQLDALSPSPSPLDTLAAFLVRVSESGITAIAHAGSVSTRESMSATMADIGAWAASLAIAVRPGQFGLDGAPLALAGMASHPLSEGMHRPDREAHLATTIETAVGNLRDDFVVARQHPARLIDALGARPPHQATVDSWSLLVGLGALTRTELARALGVSGDVAAKALHTLAGAGLISARDDGAFDAIETAA